MNKTTCKFLTFVLAVSVLLMGVLPTNALAETPHWAADAIRELNELYGTETFKADDELFTLQDAIDFLEGKLNYGGYDNINGINKEDIVPYRDTTSPITRAEACMIIYAILQLPFPISPLNDLPFVDCQHDGNPIYAGPQLPAIHRLWEMGVVAGRPDGTFGPDGEVDNATFGVLLWRTLRATGLSFGYDAGTSFVPGEYGAFEVQYLKLRTCLNDIVGWNGTINMWDVVDDTEAGNVIFQGGDFTGKEQIWDAWVAKLNALARLLSEGNVEDLTPPEVPEDFLDAIVHIVRADRARLIPNYADCVGLFSDVSPWDWFYNGVMFLRSKGIVSGGGAGNFMPYRTLYKGEMAALMLRVPDIEIDVSEILGKTEDEINALIAQTFSDVPPMYPMFEEGTAWYSEAVLLAFLNGLITYEDANAKTIAPLKEINRQEMAFAVMLLYDGYDADTVNMAVLERFADNEDVDEEYKPAMAYLVSIGTLNGRPAGEDDTGYEDGDILLDPHGGTFRAMIGAFLANVLQGLDTSKMKDYRDAVEYALYPQGSLRTSALITFTNEKTLVLTENWYLTSDLDLAVPAGTELVIDGQDSFYIYDMGGVLSNSGDGTVRFKDTVYYSTEPNILSVKSGDGIVTVNITCPKQDNVEMTVVVYDSFGRMLRVGKETVLQNGEMNITVVVPAEANKVKAMMWDGLNTMCPLCRAKEITPW